MTSEPEARVHGPVSPIRRHLGIHYQNDVDSKGSDVNVNERLVDETDGIGTEIPNDRHRAEREVCIEQEFESNNETNTFEDVFIQKMGTNSKNAAISNSLGNDDANPKDEALHKKDETDRDNFEPKFSNEMKIIIKTVGKNKREIIRAVDEETPIEKIDTEESSTTDSVNYTVDDFKRRKRKRKQPKPRSVSQGPESSAEDEFELDDTERETSKVNIERTGDKSKEIEQKPLFSQLRIPKKRQKSQHSNKAPNMTCTDISDIINKSLEKRNIPCTTNRYRRHFLKQLRKAEAKRMEQAKQQLNEIMDSQLVTGKETKSVQEQEYNDDTDSNDTNVFDGKRLDTKTVDKLECNICFKTFVNVGTFAAHYMCHSAFEKENASLLENTNSYNANSVSRNLKGTNIKDVINLDESNEHRKSLSSSIVGPQNSLADNSDSDGSSSIGFKGLISSRLDSPNLNCPESASMHARDNSSLGDNITYFCHICNQKFTNITSLQSHMTDHDTSELGSTGQTHEHFCHQCQKSFASASSYHVHCKLHSGDNPYTCHTCKKTFRDKTRLTTHIRVHTGNLKLHQKIHSADRESFCSRCKYSCRTKGELIRHLKIHGMELEDNEAPTKEDPNCSRNSQSPTDGCYTSSRSCSGDILPGKSTCSDKGPSTRSSTIRNMLEDRDPSGISSPLSLFGSEIDTFSLKQIDSFNLSSLKDHHNMLNSHFLSGRQDGRDESLKPRIISPKKDLLSLKPEEKNLMLSIDNEVEFIKAMTDAKTVSEDDKGPHTFPCPLCSAILTSYDSLNHHILTLHSPMMALNSQINLDPISRDPLYSSTVKKLYRCQECGLDFSSFPEFQIHLKSHSDKRRHCRTEEKCLICCKYVDLGELGDHMMAHAAEKTYRCEYCTKIFRRSHHLQTHMRTHTGDRPYLCIDCGKRFARGDHLQNHKRTHTGEKPYRCDVCSKTYSQSHHLLRHKRTHTGERPYKCMMCDKSFSRDHHLKKHMETHKVVIFMDKLPDSSQKRSPSNPSTMPFSNIVTRSSNRIAQLMGHVTPDGQPDNTHVPMENSASRLMERLVKRRMEEDKKDHVYLRDRMINSDFFLNLPKSPFDIQESSPSKQGMSKLASREHLEKTIQITDLLADVESHVPSKISSQLIANQVIKIAKRGQVASSSEEQAEDIQKIVDEVNVTQNEKQYGEKAALGNCEAPLTEDGMDFVKDDNMLDDRPESTGHEDTLTLEDIVNRRLMEEYGLFD